MERISITLPEKLIGDFDKVLEEKGYASRSEGIRDAIRGYIIEHNYLSEISGTTAGTVTIIYDHHESRLSERLTTLQHDFGDIIESSLHIHLDHHNCLEVIVVRGEGGPIRNLVNKLKSTKGVKLAKLTTNISEIPR